MKQYTETNNQENSAWQKSPLKMYTSISSTGINLVQGCSNLLYLPLVNLSRCPRYCLTLVSSPKAVIDNGEPIYLIVPDTLGD